MSIHISRWSQSTAYANELFLDREVIDSDGIPIGKVDDLEFDMGRDGDPTLVAILCGPTAFGPRLGGRLGTWWLAIARRLRPRDDPAAVQIPMADVERVTRETVQLSVSGANAGTWRLRRWADHKIIRRIPGGA
jgi:sporulation protein YlmC with PRC-barrel domain